VIAPRGLPERPAVVDAGVVTILAVVVFTLIGAVAWGLGHLTGLANLPGALVLVTATLLAGLVALPLTIVGGYVIAVWTYRFGWDPDNQGVPVITSVMDLSGVAIVLAVMPLFGVLPHG
jgi:mgtE-like transporter